MNDEQLAQFLARFDRYPGEPIGQKIKESLKAMILENNYTNPTRSPCPGEYVDPQPAAVDV